MTGYFYQQRGKERSLQFRACSALLVSLLADSIVSLAQPDCAPKLVNYSHGSNWLIDGGWRARSKKLWIEKWSLALHCGGALSGVQRSTKSVTFSWAVSRSQIVLRLWLLITEFASGYKNGQYVHVHTCSSNSLSVWQCWFQEERTWIWPYLITAERQTIVHLKYHDLKF